MTQDVKTLETGLDTETGEDRYRLSMTVDISVVGPCRRHVRVSVPQEDVQHFRQKALRGFMETASVPGFRPGHVPEKLVERRFKKELSEQVRRDVLLASLQQLAEEKRLDPLTEPEFDIEALVLPDDGDFQYEFDVDVQPEFEVPDYKGLRIKRWKKDQFSEEEIQSFQQRMLEEFATQVHKESPAAPGDVLVIDIEFHHEGRKFREMSDLTVRLLPTLRFPDGEITGFDTLLQGAEPGAEITTELTISPEAELPEMRNQKVQAQIKVHEVRELKLPTLDSEFLERFGLSNEQEFRDYVINLLRRQVDYLQRQWARQQVLEKITESANWELPENLVRKQTENALRREILEMQQAGFTRAQIRARENELRQRSYTSTLQALKEHFVLDRIATLEKIEASDHELDAEIEQMAQSQGLTGRRLRSQLIKSQMIENLQAQIRERKTIEFILQHANYEDVPLTTPLVPAAPTVESVAPPICVPRPITAEEKAQ
ncbi:MAG: trigger factor [Planctomycetaceae bacterium]|nr:MAG: trigger factor [Planctomycetaceae bacterium]